MIINIDRTCGSKGGKVARLVAEKYGLTYINHAYLIEKAKEKKMLDRLTKYFSGDAENLLFSFDLDEDGEEQGTFLTLLRQLMPEDNFITVGVCGNHLYRKEGALSVFLAATPREQINVVMKEVDGIDNEEDARDYIRQMNGRRRLFHEAFTCEGWGDPSRYDLCLNVSTCGVELCAAGICYAAEFKFHGKTVDQQ